MATFKYAHELEQGDVLLGTDEGRKRQADKYGRVHDYPQTCGDVLRILTDDGVHYMHPATLVMVHDSTPHPRCHVACEWPMMLENPRPIHGLGHRS